MFLVFLVASSLAAAFFHCPPCNSSESPHLFQRFIDAAVNASVADVAVKKLVLDVIGLVKNEASVVIPQRIQPALSNEAQLFASISASFIVPMRADCARFKIAESSYNWTETGAAQASYNATARKFAMFVMTPLAAAVAAFAHANATLMQPAVARILSDARAMVGISNSTSTRLVLTYAQLNVFFGTFNGASQGADAAKQMTGFLPATITIANVGVVDILLKTLAVEAQFAATSLKQDFDLMCNARC